MIDWASGFVNDGITLLRLVAIAVAIYAILKVWYLTQAFIPTLGAILLSGIALWAISAPGFAWLEQRIAEDSTVEGHGPIPAYVVANYPGSWHTEPISTTEITFDRIV